MIEYPKEFISDRTVHFRQGRTKARQKDAQMLLVHEQRQMRKMHLHQSWQKLLRLLSVKV